MTDEEPICCPYMHDGLPWVMMYIGRAILGELILHCNTCGYEEIRPR